MTRSACQWITVLLFFFSATVGCRNVRATNAEIPKVNLCELLAHSEQYVGRTVSVTVRITATKHGTGIWDPSCMGGGADLQWHGSTPGTNQLEEALRQYGMSDHPVIATLTGTWLGKERTANSFLHQPRTVFLMSDAAEIVRSKNIERW